MFAVVVRVLKKEERKKEKDVWEVENLETRHDG